MKQFNDQAFIALSTVLIICAVVLSLSISVSLLALSEAQSSFSLSNGENTLDLVEGCAEDALSKTRASASYSGGTINHPEGDCSVIISKNGNLWTLTISNTDTKYKRTIQVDITRQSNQIALNGWKEI